MLVVAWAVLAGLLPHSTTAAERSGFVENLGQWPSAVRFVARSSQATAWVESNAVRIELTDGLAQLAFELEFAPTDRGVPDASRAATASGEGDDGSLTSYFIGSNPQQWASGARTFRRVRLGCVAPGVDVVLETDGGSLRYDLELANGIDAGAVEVRVRGAQRIGVDAFGALELETALGVARFTAPKSFELLANGERRALDSRVVLLGADRFGFVADARETSSGLCIDPSLAFSTYLGGSSDQSVTAIKSAPGGDVVVAGTTDALDFPVTLGAVFFYARGSIDTFVSHFDPHGAQLLWSTYFGGTGIDEVRALAVASNGEVTLGGDSDSIDLPTTSGAFATQNAGGFDAFCARLSPLGDQLRFSTYLGGASNDRAFALDVDAQGATTLAGMTQGGFPTTPGAFDASYNGVADAFVARLDPLGAQLVYSTYIGGSLDDAAFALALEPGGAVLVAGQTESKNFPSSATAYSRSLAGKLDAWILELDSSGSTLGFSTYLGGALDDVPSAVARTSTGAVEVIGRTSSVDFPIVAGGFGATLAGPSDVFVSQLAPFGDQLWHSSYFGGSDVESCATGIGVDAQDRISFAGATKSLDLPATAGAFQVAIGNPTYIVNDGFVARVSSDGSTIEYASYFGDSDDDQVLALDFDAQGAALIGGRTQSWHFPTTPNAFMTGANTLSAGMGFVSRIFLLKGPVNYGVGKTNSFGATPHAIWTGFPTYADHDFQIGVDLGMPGSKAVVCASSKSASIPFQGGTLSLKPPLKRVAVASLDFIGYGLGDVKLSATWVGTTQYFQVWFPDPNASFGAGLSDALEVFVYP